MTIRWDVRHKGPPSVSPWCLWAVMEPAGESSMADNTGWRPPRACDDYWSEWKHCMSPRNRFHYYYIYGQALSCSQWKKDYENCREWQKTKSTMAKDALCQSEGARVAEKQKHPPVWNMRKSPPMDWYLPLGEDKPQS